MKRSVLWSVGKRLPLLPYRICSVSFTLSLQTHDTDRPGGDRQNKRQENCPWTTRTAAKLTFTRLRTEKGEKVEPDKELCHGDDDGLSQLRGEESLADMEGLPVRETLAKDHVEGNGFIPRMIHCCSKIGCCCCVIQDFVFKVVHEYRTALRILLGVEPSHTWSGLCNVILSWKQAKKKH